MLREKYQNDRAAYLNAFRPTEEDKHTSEEYFLCEGMECFTKLEKRMTRHMRERPYRERGRIALKAFTVALMGIGPVPDVAADADFVLVTIDFEGAMQNGGVKEQGVATPDTRCLFADDSQSLTSIETCNFAFAKHRNRKFRFGETFKKEYSQLRKTVLDVLNVTDDKCDINEIESMRKVVLVAHAISNELRILDALGLPIETFSHIIGVVNRHALPDSYLARWGFMRLLNRLHIPWQSESSHCGGNNANYTLRALFAYIHERCADSKRKR